jgi:hypothetical protein
MARRFTSAPDLPRNGSQEPAAALESRFRLHPNVDDELELYFAQIKEARLDDAATPARCLSLENAHERTQKKLN